MAGDINRTITIDAQDVGVQDIFSKIEKSGSDLYEKLIDKAESYSRKLNVQSTYVNNLIDKERQAKQLIAEERREALEREREMRIAQLDPKDKGFTEDKKRILEEYKNELSKLNREVKEYSMAMDEAGRKTRLHFAEGAGGRGIASGGMGRGGFAQGAIAGGLTGALTGGGLGTIAGTVVGGVGGLSPIGGTGLAILGGGLTSALIGTGERYEGVKSKLEARTGLSAVDGAMYGYTPSQRAARMLSLAQTAGQRVSHGETMNIMGVERGMGLDEGAFNALAPIRALGVKGERESPILDLASKFYQRALSSGLWDLEKDDMSAMSREIQSLGEMLQAEAGVLATPSGLNSILLRTEFAKLSSDAVGGLFSGARGQNLIMGLHQSLQSPSNQFQQAMALESILRSNPNLGTGMVGLTRARAIQSRGIYGEGYLSGVLERISQMGRDSFTRQAAFVNEFQQFMPYLDSPELAKLVEPETAKRFAKIGSEGDLKREFAGLGFGEKEITELLGKGLSETDKLTSRLVSALESYGSQISDDLSGAFNTMIDFFKYEMPNIMKERLKAPDMEAKTTPPDANNSTKDPKYHKRSRVK